MGNPQAARHPVRIGVKMVTQGADVPTLRAFWRFADEAGFDHLWVNDHLAAVGLAGVTDGADPAEDLLEGWTLLAAMASETRRIRVGCMVTAVTFRHPAMLAKMAASVDRLSGGRLEFGLGAGWDEFEHRMLDLPLGTPGERVDRLVEGLDVIEALWSPAPRVDYEGRFYRLRGAVSAPRPAQSPRPPLWLGGEGERRMLPLIAERADVWNVVNKRGLDEAVRLSGVLDRCCAAIGREPSDLRRSVQLRLNGADVVEAVAPWVAAGFTELIVVVAPAEPLAEVERIARRLPELRALAGGS